MRTLVALLIAIIGVAGATYLLYDGKINQFTYLGCLGTTALVSLAVYCSDRLMELDIKGFKIVLREIRNAVSEAKEERNRIEAAKNELAEMYGEVEKLRSEPLIMDGERTTRLGVTSGPVVGGGAIMRYVSGVVTRERERLARIFVKPKEPEALAKAILDNSWDDNVFKWVGPGATLDQPPKSKDQRRVAEDKIDEKHE